MDIHTWDLFVNYEGKVVGTIGSVDPDTFNYLILLDCVNDLALQHIPSTVSFAINISYQDCMDGESLKVNENDNDVLDMFVSYKEFHRINIFVKVQYANPLDIPSKTAHPSNEPSHSHLPTSTLQQPQHFFHGESSQPRTVNSNFTNTSCNSDAPHTSHVRRSTGPILVNYSDSEDSDDGEGECDNDGIDHVVVEEDNPDTRARKLAEVNEYFVEADDVLEFSDEDVDWMADAGALDGESSESDSSTEDDVELESENIEENLDELSDYNSGSDGGAELSDSEMQDGMTREYRTANGIPPRTDEKGFVILEKGMIFPSGIDFKQTVRDYAIEKGFTLNRIKNDNVRGTFGCKAVGCPWRIHASRLPDMKTFKIKTYNPKHNCTRVNHNTEATSTWMAKKLANSFRLNPTMSLSALQEKLRTKYHLEVSSQRQLYRAKVKAIEYLEGSHAKSFQMLAAYGDQVKVTNPGSWFKIEYYICDVPGSKSQFKRVFMSMGGLKQGFINGCRPFIGLDGCHLKGPYKGILLSAVGLDGNNGIYPIAVAVVESEGSRTWSFFLENLNHILEADHVNTQWTFITDGQKGLDTIVQQWFPGSDHRRCGWHLFNNFRARFPGTLLAKQFWQASRACTIAEFNTAMEKILKEKPAAHAFLQRLPAKMWSRHAYGQHVKSDHITNNHTESFNNWLGDLRCKPIIGLLDVIRKKMMERTQMRNLQSGKWMGKLCKNIRKKLDKIQEEGRLCRIQSAGQGEFEIMDVERTYTVNLGTKVCSCRSWMISGIPCKHASCAVAFQRDDLEDYVAKCYYKEKYVVANGEYIIHPIDDPKNWGPGSSTAPEPPQTRRAAGRPQNARRKNLDLEEPARATPQPRTNQVKCKKCNKFANHNARTCGRKPVKKMTSVERRSHWAQQEAYNPHVVNLDSQSQSQSQASMRPSGSHDIPPQNLGASGSRRRVAADAGFHSQPTPCSRRRVGDGGSSHIHGETRTHAPNGANGSSSQP